MKGTRKRANKANEDIFFMSQRLNVYTALWHPVCTTLKQLSAEDSYKWIKHKESINIQIQSNHLDVKHGPRSALIKIVSRVEV